MEIGLLVLFVLALLFFGSDPAPAPNPIVVFVPQQQAASSGGGILLLVLALVLIGVLIVFG
jgi:hypothetical protein